MPKPKLYILPNEPAVSPQPPNNLPAHPKRLVGRDSDVQVALNMLTMLTDPQVRLLTLVGPGGVGKTTLALHLAQQLLQEFDDGVFFVELAAITDSASVIPTIAATLQLREEPNTPLLSTLKSHLLNKNMLLVLDNFEQVIPAGSAVRDVAELLAACPDMKVLVTSRAPLGLRAEQEFAVSPLSMPERNIPTLQRSNVPTLLQYGAIELFTQRASTLQAEFELTEDNAEAVVEICRRVDGLPLAIELVAAHVRLLSPRSVLARLTNPLRLLTGGPQDAPARHKTMRDTIEWSYNLLDEDEQRLFRRLSVFVGGFEVRAAEAVCNQAGNISVEANDPQAMEVLEGLEALIDKSLVRRLEQNEDGERDRRLGMLETVREYAYELLQESEESASVARRHAQYFLALSEEAEPHLTGPDQKAWVARLDDEHNNLRAALSRRLPDSGQSEADPQAAWIGLRLTGALWQFWAIGNLSEGRRWLQAALQAVERLGEDGLRQVETQALAKAQAKALNGAGTLARLAGDFPDARQSLHSGLEISRRLGDRQEVAVTLSNLGSMATMHGDYAEARRYLTESLMIRRDLGLELEVAHCLTNLGNVAMLEEGYAEARQLHAEGLAIKRRTGDKEGIGRSLHSMATIARRQGNHAEARRLDEETLAIARELGNKPGIAYSLRDLGKVAYEQSDYPTALTSFLESLVLFRELENVLPTVECLIGLARALAHTGQPEYAARLFGTAHTLLESTEGQLDPADSIAYERDLAALRAQLSEKPFTAAWEEGRTMTLDDALELASQAKVQNPRMRGSGGLTSREYEIATLVTRGLSNEEIAHTLVLSERTIEMHVSNALRKLGLTKRTQIAAWAIEQGIAQKPPQS